MKILQRYYYHLVGLTIVKGIQSNNCAELLGYVVYNMM